MTCNTAPSWTFLSKGLLLQANLRSSLIFSEDFAIIKSYFWYFHDLFFEFPRFLLPLRSKRAGCDLAAGLWIIGISVGRTREHQRVIVNTAVYPAVARLTHHGQHLRTRR